MTAAKSIHIRFAYSLVGVKELPITGAKHPLQKEAQRWVLISGVVAVLFGLALFLLWQWWSTRTPEIVPMSEIKIVRYQDLGVPPSLARTSSSQVSVAQAMAAAPEILIPEPVPDELAVTTTIMTQDQIAQALAPITASDLGGDLGGKIQIEDLPTGAGHQPKDWTGSVDELPVLVSMNRPVYPEMARLAEVEGSVLLQIQVGKDGRVKDVRYLDGPSMLKNAAITAAKSAIFRPATIDKRPVEVWVEIPIDFRLQN